MYQRNEDVWKHFSGDQKADYGREEGAPVIAWVSRYTLAFINGYLKHDAAALAWLKKTPAENGVPKHFLSVDYRAAKGIPATLEVFRAEVGGKGFDHAAEIYIAMHKDNPDFKLEEGVLEAWGDSLTGDDHPAEAIAILQLNVSLYPDSSDGYGHLGGAYAKAGQKQLAIDNYKKSLELNPANDNAKEKLKVLDAAPAR